MLLFNRNICKINRESKSRLQKAGGRFRLPLLCSNMLQVAMPRWINTRKCQLAFDNGISNISPHPEHYGKYV